MWNYGKGERFLKCWVYNNDFTIKMDWHLREIYLFIYIYHNLGLQLYNLAAYKICDNTFMSQVLSNKKGLLYWIM